MNILKETQNDRDKEISEYTGINLYDIQKFEIASKESILINVDGDINKDDYTYLYKDFKHLNIAEYLKTLSALTVSRRSRYIMRLFELSNEFKGKKILDFGSGSGSHGIACSQLGADQVCMLDVDGPLFKFAQWRVTKRNINNIIFVTCDKELQENYYDIVICLDVLEHVADPIKEIKRITKSLKSDGFIALEVSKMKKFTSGHFSKSIDKWIFEGPSFMDKHYELIEKNIWKRNG